jgi:hypothetical protein
MGGSIRVIIDNKKTARTSRPVNRVVRRSKCHE